MVPAGRECVSRSMQQTSGVISSSVDDAVLGQCLNEISKAAAVQFQMAQKMQSSVMKIMDELAVVRGKRQFGEEEQVLVDFLRDGSTGEGAFDGTTQALKPSDVFGSTMDTDAKREGDLRQVLSSASIRTTTTHQSLQTSLSDEVDQSPKAVGVLDDCTTNDVSSDQVSGHGKTVPTAEYMLSAAKGKEKDDDDDDDDDEDDDDEDYEEEEDAEDEKVEAGDEDQDVEGDEDEADDDGEDEGETEDNGEGEDDDGEEGDEEDMDGDEDPDEEPEDEEGDDGEDEDDEEAEGESEEEVPEVEPPKKKRK